MNPSEQQIRKALSLYLLALTTLTLVAAAVVLVRSRLLHEPYPYNWLLYLPEVRFSDFTVYYPRFEHFRTAEFFAPGTLPFNYLATAIFAWAFFIKLFPQPLLVYLIAVNIWATILATVGLREFARFFPRSTHVPIFIALTLGMAYPFAFLVDRGNLEGVIWFFMSLALYCFVRQRYWIAALMIAVAAAIKIYPAIFLLLFCNKKLLRYGVFGAASALLIDTAASIGLGIGYRQAMSHILDGLRSFQELGVYTYSPLEVGFSHGAFGIVRQGIHWAIPGTYRQAMAVAVPWYGAVVLIAFGLLYFFRLRKLPMINQVLGLSATSLALPFVSGDYRLVNLYAPFILFLVYLRKDVCTQRHAANLEALCGVLLPFAVLFTPQSYVLYHSVSFGGQIKAVALLWLLIMSLRVPFPSSIFGELPSVAVLSEAPVKLVSGETGPF